MVDIDQNLTSKEQEDELYLAQPGGFCAKCFLELTVLNSYFELFGRHKYS
jgi:hypothetical protein